MTGGKEMRLKWARVENFRSIVTAEIDIHDFTTIIGPNNSGKSTILHAIEMALTGQSPDPDDWPGGDFSKEIVVELRFDDIKDWEAEIKGIAGIVYKREIHLRTQYTIKDDGKPERPIYSAKKRAEEITGMNNDWASSSDEIKGIATSIGITAQQFRGVSSREKLRDHIRQHHNDLITYGEEGFSSEGISISQALQQGLPKLIYIPAVTDASAEAKPGAKTTFGILLEKVLLPAVAESVEYQSIQRALDDLRSRLIASDDTAIPEARSISSAISERLQSLVSTSAKIIIDQPDFNKPLTNAFGMRLDDGTETPVHLQGHGVQRALIFALLEELARQTQKRSEKNSDDKQPLLLLFEEPELFIHPHLMRRLRDTLIAIGLSAGWQVVITTHSPFLISVADNPMSLVTVTRENGRSAPVFKQLKDDPFRSEETGRLERDALRASLDFHPTVCQAFFGSHTVLVEGDSEVAVLAGNATLLSIFGVQPEAGNHVSIVSCGGKWTIPAVARLLIGLGLSVRVIHDEDRKNLSDEELNERPKIHPFHANRVISSIVGSDNVFVCKDNLEELLWNSKNYPKRDKPFNCWKKIRTLMRNPEQLRSNQMISDLVKFAYNE